MAFPLGLKTLEQKTQTDPTEKLPLIPRTLMEKPLADTADTQNAVVPRTQEPKPPSGAAENLGLVPRTLDPKSPFELGRFPLHSRERPMFAVSDDRVMLDRVRNAHSPDMISFEAESLLLVVEDIFKSPVPTIDASTLSKTAPVFKDYDQASFEAFADLIEKICCEIECRCIQGGESHGLASGIHLDSRNTTTFTVLQMVSKYRWDAKLVLILSALAVKFGVFLLLAQTFTTSQLTKSLALIKQLPGVFSHPTALTQRLEKTRLLMQDMVDITSTIIKIYGLPPQYISDPFNDHIPLAVYWSVRSVLVCASHISSISGFGQEQIMSFMEISEIHENSERLRKMNAYLIDQLNRTLDEIERERVERYIEDILKPGFGPGKPITADVVPPLLQLFRPIDYLYHGPGFPKKTVSINVLGQKNVLLFISDPENMQEEIYMLEYIFSDAWQQSFEIVWVPVKNSAAPWTESEKKNYESQCANMRWYILPEPWMLSEAATRFIRQVWNFKKKPILVALDTRGQVASKNAFPMVWIWHSAAAPFTRSRELDLWVEQEQAWNLEFLIDGTDQTALTSMVEGKFVCLYGGEDIEWIRKYTREWRNVANAAGIEVELVYVGKREPKERTRRIMNTIQTEKLSHTLQDLFQVWFFWTRIESMWESRQQILKHRTITDETDREYLLQEITTLLSYGGNTEGWGLVSRSTEEMVRARGDEFVVGLTEFDQWRIHINEKGFLRSLRDHLLGRRPEHHCTRFLLPAASGIIPEKMICSECGRTMERYFLYQCCIE